MRRRAALLFLFLFSLPATGAGADLLICDDCLQMAVLSCCSGETGEDECAERCGSCEDDTTISVRAILARKSDNTEANHDVSYILPNTPELFDYDSAAYSVQPPYPRPPQETIPPHIPTTILLS